MKQWLFGLLLGTALVAAQGAVALTLVSPGQNLQDPTAQAFGADGDAPIQRLSPPRSRDNSDGTLYRSRDGGFSMAIKPFSSNGFGGNSLSDRAPYATNSPFWGMEPGSGFRTLNQQ
ncbi:MAG: hypothetical protein JWL84_4126 [Rhodospirillales bacterium]|jgi:hypothetical protein|nr:hypothetical protein [Rhodospirillales bacterium]